jgi:hypothetical protein
MRKMFLLSGVVGLALAVFGLFYFKSSQAQNKSFDEDLRKEKSKDFSSSLATVQLKEVSQIVNNSKAVGAAFERRELFQIAASKPAAGRAALRDAVGDGVLIDLNRANVQKMLEEKIPYLTLPLPAASHGETLELELVKTDIFAPGFSVKTSKTSKERLDDADWGVHYRGVVKGRENSLAAISIFENEVMGFFSTETEGNSVVGRLSGGGNVTGEHIVYADKNLKKRPVAFCAAETPTDFSLPVSILPSPETTATATMTKCVRIYIEANYDLYLNKGSIANTVNYIAGMFNQSAALFANDGISVSLSEILVWNSPSPYTGSNSNRQLDLFVANRPSFNGDLAHLVSLQGYGGLAYVNSSLCSSGSLKYAFSGLETTYSNVPTYSWSVSVFTHETGHNLGSPHTHDCVWNGNNTAIDGCAAVYPAGGCAQPGFPAGGGTIMSYCHLQQGVGINFNFGFGTQPRSLMLSRINGANCLSDCGNCTLSEVDFGQTINGILSPSDCAAAGKYQDQFTFSGIAGQQISVSMSSTAFDTYLYLLDSAGQVIAEDDDGGGGTNSRIPQNNGFFTLPTTGIYTIKASSYFAGAVGSYSLNLSLDGCAVRTIAPGQTVSGSLANYDCVLSGSSRFVDVYSFQGTAGQRISASMNSPIFDTYLYLANSSNQILIADDDGGEGTNSRIPPDSGFFTLPATGTYFLWASSFSDNSVGSYSLSLSQCAYSVAPIDIGTPEIPAAGGTRGFSVTAPNGCPWLATSNAAWIVITGGSSSGSGNGMVNFSILPNSGPARSGTVTIAGRPFTLFQQAAQQPAPRRLFDFDGDGRTDYSVFRPTGGTWFIWNSSNSSFRAQQFGISTDKIAPADYDGDGRADIAVFRSGVWYLLQSQLGFGAGQFGQAGDIPVPADYDGDGKADLAVFRPSNGTWYLLRSQLGFTGTQFGISTDNPVPADFDGDGKADLVVYRDGTWFLLRSQEGFGSFQFGIAGDKPVPADYDGDAKADYAVFRSGTWYLWRSQTGFGAVQFGLANDRPAAGDYDGDGKTDIAVWRPGNGTFYVLQSQAGFAGFQFGTNGDAPVASAYIP